MVSSEDFITFGSKTATTQVINYGANTDLARTGQVTFTSTGGGGGSVSQTVDIRQLAAASTIRLMTTFAPGYTMVPAEPIGGLSTGTIDVTIILGGGAETWTITKDGDDDDAFIESFTESGNRANNTLTITYNANTGVERSATLTIVGSGSSGSTITRINFNAVGWFSDAYFWHDAFHFDRSHCGR